MGGNPRSWKPFLTKSCGDVHSWRDRGIATSDSYKVKNKSKSDTIDGTEVIALK